MTSPAGGGWTGRPIRRLEDERLIKGEGQFVSDITLPGTVEAVFVRSPYARARIRSLDVSEAASLPKVVGVFTHVDFPPGPLPPFLWDAPPTELVEAVQPQIRSCHPPFLASETVRYVGEALAVVVAEDLQSAIDAAEAVEIDFEVLEPVVDVEAALAPSSPLVHDDWGDNVAARVTVRRGDVEAAFGEATTVVQGRFATPRLAGAPIETRGAVATVDDHDRLTVWSSTQNAHPLRNAIARVAGMPRDQVRVVAPDVGGGFGIKGVLYPEDLIVSLLALRLERPVRWIEGRREHLQSAIHARDQIHEIDVALGWDGELLGVRDRFWVDNGAYNPLGIVIPYNTIAHLIGPYRVASFHVEGSVVLTDKVPAAPYRGAGRPDAVFAMERILDRSARVLGVDPLELRLRNLIQPEELPYDAGILYRDGKPLVLDSGDYPAMLRRAADLVGYDEAVPNREEVSMGIGLACFVEGTGIGPFEGAVVTMQDQTVLVHTGASSQGQGHATVLAQLCADHLGVTPDQVRVVGGDTDGIEHGWGTVASRSAVVAGSAVAEASKDLLGLLLACASEHLEVSVDDLVVENGSVKVIGTDVALDLFEVARLARGYDRIPAASAVFQPHTVTWAAGAHAAVVQVEEETGQVEIVKYVVVHDCGIEINPQVVEGQVMGGTLQGIGQALYEQLLYDETGQLITGTLGSYQMPTAVDAPPVIVEAWEFPSPLNPLGLKGVGEGGAVPPPAAIANAVEDALSHRGVQVDRTPLSPAHVRTLIERAQNKRRGGEP